MHLKSKKYGDFSDLGELLKIMASGHIIVSFDPDDRGNHIVFSSVDSDCAYKFTKITLGNDPHYEVRTIPPSEKPIEGVGPG